MRRMRWRKQRFRRVSNRWAGPAAAAGVASSAHAPDPHPHARRPRNLHLLIGEAQVIQSGNKQLFGNRRGTVSSEIKWSSQVSNGPCRMASRYDGVAHPDINGRHLIGNTSGEEWCRVV